GVRSSDQRSGDLSGVESTCREDDRTWPLRGGKSRNKVSVGEPVEGSLSCNFNKIGRERNGLGPPTAYIY
ncbi:hypothetical protein TNCT_32711, partial [Trichonephila clavata]